MTKVYFYYRISILLVVNIKRELIKIFADTHKIIASNIYENVYEKYDLQLDKKKLLWWSIAPDILPQYKFVRHYKAESLDYIIREIIKVIYLCRYIEFNKVLDPISVKILSKKIGLISHYISDYFCLPHAKRWTFSDSMVIHLKYESDLDEFVKTHTFDNNIQLEDIEIDSNIKNMYDNIKNYIENGLELYLQQELNFENDLNFANLMNIKISNFILDTIEEYSEEVYTQFAFEV